jgi:cytochrome c5
MRAAIGLLLAMFITVASAHHSIIPLYDLKSERVLRGRVARFEWANPHVHLYIDVPKEDGAMERWTLLGLPPTMLQRRGWSRNSLKVGETVSVRVFPSHIAGKTSGAMRTIIKIDGTELSNSPPEDSSDGGFPGAKAEATTGAKSLSGVWLTAPGDLAVRFGILGQAEPELTPLATAARKTFDPNRDIPGIDCVPLVPPISMSIASVMSVEIGRKVTRIRSELEGVERTVHMNVSSHEGVRESLYGHSIGHWEGNVLVIDTARYTANRIGTVAGVPSGPRKHLIERLQLDPDGTTLTYAFKLEDPDYLAAPMSGSMKWRYAPKLKYSPVECNIETARRYLDDVPAPSAAAQSASAPMTGEVLVKQTCSVCHTVGIGGAPKLGDAAGWGPRTARGKDVLYAHAIQGFKGETGICPQKGGRWDVPDAVVRQAVDYMSTIAK